MKEALRVLFTLRHLTKQVYRFISQYSSTYGIKSKVNHLSIWRDIKNTDPASTRKY